MTYYEGVKKAVADLGWTDAMVLERLGFRLNEDWLILGKGAKTIPEGTEAVFIEITKNLMQIAEDIWEQEQKRE